MGEPQQQDGQQVTQGRHVHLQREVAERLELAAQMLRGHGQGLRFVGDGSGDDGGVWVVDPGGRRGGRVERVLPEEDQRALRPAEVAPLLHLPRAHPQPGAGPQHVTGEVDGVPEVARREGEQVVEVGSLRPVQGGRGDPAAQLRQ
ncbi:hypothetical protein QFZ66_006004 [Streptomyces sp. B4I13]|nr:hypothetical protein [Streptomyces sp. B4I13]